MQVFAVIVSIIFSSNQNLCDYSSPPPGDSEPFVEYLQPHLSDSSYLVKATCFCYCTTEENTLYLFQTSGLGKIQNAWLFESATDLQSGKSENSIVEISRTPESQSGEGSADKEVFQISGKDCKSKSAPVPSLDSPSIASWQKLIQKYFDTTEVERRYICALDAFKHSKPGQAADLLTPKLESFSMKAKIGILNDYGFFLEQANRPAEAIPVLEKVIAFDPSRTPAYLNLADAYAKAGDKEKAKANYGKYVEQMEAAHKGAKVPSRVRDFLKN